jgi:exodeoxyribonuclease V gamma subunit
MDCLEETFIHPKIELREHLLTKHPLQPFCLDYFAKGSPLYSYSKENLKCAEALSGNINTDTSFIEDSLPLPEEEFKTIDLRDLTTFFANPSKFLLQNRLNLSLEIQEEAFEDQETFTLKGLERYLVDQALLNGLSAGLSREDLFKIAEAGGMLPHGTVGESEYDTAFNTIADFLKSIKIFTKGNEACTIPLDINLGDFRLKGNINSLYENRLVKHRCAIIKPKDTLSAWIEHLALGIATYNEKDSSILSGLSVKRTFEAWEFNHPDNNEAVLLSLLDLYYKGLTIPLPFFPEASFAYANKFHKDQDKSMALKTADNKLIGDEYSSGDLSDVYQNLCFKDSSCLNNSFIETAAAICQPIIENSKKLKL